MGLMGWADKNRPGGPDAIAKKAERAAKREELKAEIRDTREQYAAKKVTRDQMRKELMAGIAERKAARQAK